MTIRDGRPSKTLGGARVTNTRIIVEGRGRHFDPDVVDAFMACRDAFADIAVRFADPLPEGAEQAR